MKSIIVPLLLPSIRSLFYLFSFVLLTDYDYVFMLITLIYHITGNTEMKIF